MKTLNLFPLVLALLASFTFSGCSEEKIAQGIEITFTDSNLEQAVRDQINQPEGPIYLADVEDIEALNLEKYDIENLSGIEHFTNLSSLNLENNSIQDLSLLANLTNLTFLNLRKNDIEDITPLSQLTNLTDLYLCSNNITDISALSPLINLEMLTLVLNPIKTPTPLCGLGTDFNGTIAFHNMDYMIFGEQQVSHLEGCLPNADISFSGDII